MAKTIQLTEYSVLEIDQYGDAYNCHYHDSQAESLRIAAELELPDDETVAIVVERYWRKHRVDDGEEMDRDQTVIATYGDEQALLEGGWIA